MVRSSCDCCSPKGSPRSRIPHAEVRRAGFRFLEDIAFITWSHTRILEATATIAPDAWRRHLALTLDGLRASAAHPLPVPPITEGQLMQSLRGRPEEDRS